jgi:hypothetical protein
VPPFPPARDGLADKLIDLAGTPDDDSAVASRLSAIAQLAADLIDAVSYASVTRRGESAYSTVAATSALALAVDEAQYADKTGPCLDAIETGSPTVVPHILATMTWPGFRDEAHRLGLRSSLSIPLFAGRGLPLAALNLYGHDPRKMAPLSAAVLAAYDDRTGGDAGIPRDELCDGAADLVDGLLGAFAVRARIQQAIGMIIADRHTNAELAYSLLRSKASATDGSLVAAAAAIIADHHHR